MRRKRTGWSTSAWTITTPGCMCGRTLREALPDGGKVMIFVGRLDQDNAKRRRQGFIDGLLDGEPDPQSH